MKKIKITQEQLDKLAFPFLDREFEGIEKYMAKYFDGIVNTTDFLWRY